jgi:hypothetical protein
MSLEINSLMGVVDKEVWEREGFFNTIDNLCRDIGGANKVNEPLTHVVIAPQPPSMTFTKVMTKGSPVVGSSHQVLQLEGGMQTEFSRRKVSNGIDVSDYSPRPNTPQGVLEATPTPVDLSHETTSMKDMRSKKTGKAWKPKK